MPLKFVDAGIEAQVEAVSGDQSHVQRLHELGICQGCKLKVLCKGTSCIVKIAGSKICFRESDLANVLVRVGSVA